MGDWKVEVGNKPYLVASSMYIRMKVFILEKGLSLEDEFDQNDTIQTTYAVLFDGNKPIATARSNTEKKEILRIGRVATLKEYRGNQCGSKVFKALEDLAVAQNDKKIFVHAELTAAKFYEKLGYVRTGAIYEEDKVSCITLTKMI